MTEFEAEMLATMQAVLKCVERLDENINSVIEDQRRAQKTRMQDLEMLQRGPRFP